MKTLLPFLALICMGIFTSILQAQPDPASGNPWTFIDEGELRAVEGERDIVPQRYLTARLDVAAMHSILKEAPLWFTEEARSKEVVLSLPMPDGRFERFRVEYAPVMAPELAARYPMIRAYAGIGIDDPAAYLRFAVTQFGLNAIILKDNGGAILIDPNSSENDKDYVVYFLSDYPSTVEWSCSTISPEVSLPKPNDASARLPGNCKFRAYELALACTGEYGIARGGTKSSVMAAFNTTLTRVNSIFERDASIFMMLVPENDEIIFLDPETDPYSDNFNPQILIQENPGVLNDYIGFSNYDVGHVLATFDGGLAELSSVCAPNAYYIFQHKARGTTGSRNPAGPLIDMYLTHELGHQFSATHTFNNSCQSNRYELTAFEPGSGSTIMSYAGICVPNVKTGYQDEYFHIASLVQIRSFISGIYHWCYDGITMNEAPEANAGPDYFIPKSTPFVLTGTGSDPDDPNDQLTYCWEQWDLGPLTNQPPSANATSGPQFRSYPPSKSPGRYFPNLESILNGSNSSTWEVLPTVSRPLHFYLTVRDNHNITGCFASDGMTVTVSGSSGPFLVTSPNTAVSWPALSQQTITWNPATTFAFPVLCTQVDILLSVDGGYTYPYQLATATPNDGSHVVTLPNNQTQTARIMVKGTGNIFFDVSNADFKITVPVGGGVPGIEWQNTIGGNDIEHLNALQQTSDGGYILGGYSSSNISGDKTENSQGGRDYWVVKLNTAGNISWQKTIGGSGWDEIESIQQTSDGGYILGGHSNSNISGDKSENSQGGRDYWVVKLGPTGNIAWQNTIGGNSNEHLLSIQQTSDGGFILGGNSPSNISGDKTENSQGSGDYWVVKLNSIGNISWQNTIGGSDIEYLSSIQQTTDGGYILGGYSSSNISGDKTENSQGGRDYWVVKLNAAGNISWQNTIGGSSWDHLQSIQQTNDGGYILGGYSYSDISGDKTEINQGGADYWIVKLNATGNIVWQNTIGGNGIEYFHSIKQTSDGGYILGGDSDSNISGDKTENSQGVHDYWIVKLDAAGNISWQKTIGGSQSDILNYIQQTSDGGYILGGYSDSNISGDKTENSQGGRDYWVVKLSPDCPSFTLNFTRTNPSCNGNSTGSVRVDPPGRATDYTYLWSNGQTTRTISNLKAGAYTVTVTKIATGCTAIGTAVLKDPPVLVNSFSQIQHPMCDGPTGSITANGAGGTPLYNYLWNTGATSQTINNLPSGTYRVTVTDSKGCIAKDITALSNFHNQPPVINSVSVVPSGGRWKATVYASGNGPLQYRRCPNGVNCSPWSNSNIFNNLTAGQYTFEVKDTTNSCTGSFNQQVPPPSGSYVIQNNPAQAKYLRAFPNPTTGILQLQSNQTITNTRIYDILGQLVLEVAGEDIREIDLSLFPAGVYTLDIRFAEDGEREIVRVVKE